MFHADRLINVDVGVSSRMRSDLRGPPDIQGASDQTLLPEYDQQPSKPSFSTILEDTQPTPSDEAVSQRRRRSPRWIWLSWKWELISWFGGLSFFVTIIAVLGVLNGRPMPNLLFGITPNALIGLLATLAEFLLIVPVHSAVGQIKWLQALQKRPMDEFRIIDEASRGPWGSVLLLSRRKGGYVLFLYNMHLRNDLDSLDLVRWDGTLSAFTDHYLGSPLP